MENYHLHKVVVISDDKPLKTVMITDNIEEASDEYASRLACGAYNYVGVSCPDDADEDYLVNELAKMKSA